MIKLILYMSQNQIKTNQQGQKVLGSMRMSAGDWGSLPIDQYLAHWNTKLKI